MQLSLLTFGIFFVPKLIASPAPERRADYVVHEKRLHHPSWTRVRRVEPHTTLPLRIGLKQQNLDLLADHLISVSSPESSSYGQHWTPDKVVEVFAPPDFASETVRKWLIDAGFGKNRIRRSTNKAWIDVVGGATSDELERLLDARYHIFKREDGGEHIACDSYSLPRNIAEIVDIVTPTVQAHPQLDARNTDTRASQMENELKIKHDVVDLVAPTGCDKLVTPDCLKALYNMSYVPRATDRNTFGIASYYTNTYLQSDLDSFFRNFSPSLVGKSPQLVSIDGGTLAIDSTSRFSEDAWILEYSMTLVQPQPVTLLQTGNKQTGQITSFNEWLDAVDGSYCTSNGGDDFTYDPQLPSPFPGGLTEHSCGIIKSPNVVSNSQGASEYKFSKFYLERQCAEFGKLGLMGVTILYGAGNTGVAGTSGYCSDDNGSVNLNATNFIPTWPASCPWVTVVGGTQVKANATAEPGAEEVWNRDLTLGFFSSGGGGFSNNFPTPSYQKQPVKTYIQDLKKSDPGLLKHFNANGRAYPDLSANANNFFAIVNNGSVSALSGTSGAVPTVASIISLVNDARIAAGKTPVGFINPAIYSPGFATAFNDITSGTNQGCKGLQGDRGGGFKAGKGWDPASGVGTPNLGLLIDEWLALP